MKSQYFIIGASVIKLQEVALRAAPVVLHELL